MNRMWTRSTILAATLLMAAPAAMAQQQPGIERPGVRPVQPGQNANNTEKMLSQLDLAQASKLVGKQVTDQQGQQIGKIQDVIIDPRHGIATFALLQIQPNQQNQQQPGQLNQQQQPGQADQQQPGQPQAQVGQQKIVLLPFEALRIDEQMPQQVKLSVARQQIEQRPAFQETQMQQLKDKDFVKQQYQAFGFQPYWEQARRQGALERLRDALPGDDDELVAHKFSQLKNKPIQDSDQQALGQCKDLLIDMEEGRIAYLVVGLQGAAANQQRNQAQQDEPGQRPQIGQAGGQMALVPWAAVEFEADRQQLVIDTDRQTLQRNAFAEGQWPNLADEQVARNLHQQFGEQPYWEVYGYPRYEEGQQRNGREPSTRPGEQRNGQQPNNQQREPIRPLE